METQKDTFPAIRCKSQHARRVDSSTLVPNNLYTNPRRKWRKTKKLLEERNGESDRRGDGSSNFIVKKVRISVYLKLNLDSLHTSVLSLEAWILPITVWVIITWQTSTMVPTVFHYTGPYLWHTCPTRHLKVQSSEDTCEVACASQKDGEFERQPSLPGLLQDTVSAHFVRLLRR